MVHNKMKQIFTAFLWDPFNFILNSCIDMLISTLCNFFGPPCTLARPILGDYFDANFRWSVFWHLSCKVGPLCVHLTSLLWNNNNLLCCWVQNVTVCLCLILIWTFVLLPLFEWFLVLFLTLLQCTSSTSIKSFGLSNNNNNNNHLTASFPGQPG